MSLDVRARLMLDAARQEREVHLLRARAAFAGVAETERLIRGLAELLGEPHGLGDEPLDPAQEASERFLELERRNALRRPEEVEVLCVPHQNGDGRVPESEPAVVPPAEPACPPLAALPEPETALEPEKPQTLQPDPVPAVAEALPEPTPAPGPLPIPPNGYPNYGPRKGSVAWRSREVVLERSARSLTTTPAQAADVLTDLDRERIGMALAHLVRHGGHGVRKVSYGVYTAAEPQAPKPGKPWPPVPSLWADAPAQPALVQASEPAPAESLVEDRPGDNFRKQVREVVVIRATRGRSTTVVDVCEEYPDMDRSTVSKALIAMVGAPNKHGIRRVAHGIFDVIKPEADRVEAARPDVPGLLECPGCGSDYPAGTVKCPRCVPGGLRPRTMPRII